MKYYGKIEDNNDLVNKKYVDDNIGSIPNDGKLKIRVDEGTPVEVFSANKSTDSTIEFKAGDGISLTQSQTGGITITNTSGSGTPSTPPGDGTLQVDDNNGNPIDLFKANQSTSSNSLLNFIGTNGITVSTSSNDKGGADVTISGSSGNPGDGTLYIQADSANSTSLFTANQSTNTDSTLNFIGAGGITITKTHPSSRSTNITITGSGGTGSNSYNKYSQNTTTSTLSIPSSYKNVVVKFYYNNISTPGAGGVSYTLNLSSGLNEGDEMYIYLRNSGDTAGVNIQVPTSFTFTGSGDSTTHTYPIVYNGYYTNTAGYNNETLNLQYSAANRTITFTSLVLHVFFDGEVYYINKLQYSPSVT
jgi:hypothetical protein